MRLLKPKDITDVNALFDSLEWDINRARLFY